MLLSIAKFFEGVYLVMLLGFAIVGALRGGAWIVRRNWNVFLKAILFILIGVAILGFVRRLGGGPKDDLRILTEILATAGLFFALEWLFRHIRADVARFCFVATALIFMVVTWGDTLQRVFAVASSPAPVASMSARSAVPVVQTQPGAQGGLRIDKADLCADPELPFVQRRILQCP